MMRIKARVETDDRTIKRKYHVRGWVYNLWAGLVAVLVIALTYIVLAAIVE